MLVPLEKILLGLGAAAVILLGILITTNVVARAVFASSVPDSVTMVRELMVAAILLPLAAATANRAHVSVAFISDRFSPRLRSWSIVLGSVMGMIALAALIYAGTREFLSVCWLRLAELATRDIRTILSGGIVSDEQDHTIELLAENEVL